MSFKKPLPTWKAQGIKPPEHKLEEGWKAQDKPPAGWLNWQANTTYEALQELQDNAVDHRDVTSEPSANGVVRLNEAGKLNEAVLAGAEHKEITLKPGVQIVESDQDTPFNFGSVQGRTLVNLLGRKGGCESLSDVQYPANSSTIELDASNKTNGMSSIKVTSISNQAYGVFIDTPIDNTKHYIAMADIKNGTSVSATLRASKTDYTVINNSVLSASKSFQTLYTALKPTDLTGIQTLRLYARFKEGAAGEVGNVDSLRLYEISQTEYEAIAMMSPEQVAAKYPYVGSMTNVTNPYAMATGDNLLPPFYEWEYLSSSLSSIAVRGRYEVMVSNSDASSGAGMRYYAKVKGGLAYTLSADPIEGDVSGGEVYAYGCDASKNRITGKLTDTLTVDSNASYIEVVCNSTKSGVAVIGTFIFRKPMLTVGTQSKPFKPQSRSMWAAECQLASNFVDGSNADVLFTDDDGLPYVLEKWKKVTLDGSYNYNVPNDSYTGRKRVRALGIGSDAKGSNGDCAIKYDGTILTPLDWSKADSWGIDNQANHIIVSISNTDSGWGDAYTPTADEIKAYFLGWKMGDNTKADFPPWNGTGLKAWYKLYCGQGVKHPTATGAPIIVDAVSDVCPKNVNDQGYTPYRLQYLKTTPNVKPVSNYETGLTLCAGSNVVEVGSGIVIREKVNPVYHSASNLILINWNNLVAKNSILYYKAKKILNIHRDANKDYIWSIDGFEAYGQERAKVGSAFYDPTAVYHVTYTMLNPTLSAPINGNVATNLRGTVSDLVQRSGDVERRLSVVENQKAEKDNTVVWITPALLNGWTLSSNGVFPARYCKDGVGNVHVNGIVTGGATETVVFRLPAGYRPKTTIRTPTTIMSGTNVFIAYLDIKASGDVIAVFPTQSTHLSLQMSFLAEQ